MPPRVPKGKEGCVMTDKTTIEINVDTFSDRDSYFVGTEVEARSVNIYGPFTDPQTAQKLKADRRTFTHSASILVARKVIATQRLEHLQGEPLWGSRFRGSCREIITLRRLA